MTDFYFVGKVNSNWNEKGNWSKKSGGIGGFGIPSKDCKAILDNKSPDCIVEKNYDPMVSEMLITHSFENTLNLGKSTFEITGHLELGRPSKFEGIIVDIFRWIMRKFK